MNPSLQQLAATLLGSETDDSDPSGGKPLDANFTVSDFDKESLSKLYQRFQAFVSKAEAEITKIKGSDWSSIDDFHTGSGFGGFHLEHDYIMTVNGHGCGFREKHDWEPEVGKILTKLAKADSEIHCFIDENSVYIEFV